LTGSRTEPSSKQCRNTVHWPGLVQFVFDVQSNEDKTKILTLPLFRTKRILNRGRFPGAASYHDVRGECIYCHNSSGTLVLTVVANVSLRDCLAILVGTKSILREQIRGWRAWSETIAAGMCVRTPARGGDGGMHGMRWLRRSRPVQQQLIHAWQFVRKATGGRRGKTDDSYSRHRRSNSRERQLMGAGEKYA
jgi:hypothetical protein